MTYSFDQKSGCRERLFLLSKISLKMDNPANYAYSPERDRWICAQGGELEVRYEASHALEVLASRGIDRKAALEMAGYPEV